MGKTSTSGRTMHRLSDAAVKAEKRPGRHADGAGLYLNVSPTGSRSWVFMWVKSGKRREAGLGAYPAVGLAEARRRAVRHRETVAAGGDPIAEKAKEAEPTFGKAADLYIESIKGGWHNAKHEYQWRQTLGDSYCSSLRPKLVSQVTTADVLAVLSPIWITKSETAARLRGRIERVLDFAKTKEWRSGENPAAWRGHLANILPKRAKHQRGHQAAMHYGQVPAFVQRLRLSEAMAARALEFAILTAGRSNEVLGATWSEIDFDLGLWNVPKERMKAREPHTVPLSPRAHELLAALHQVRVSDFVFPGTRPKKPLSNMSMLMLLRRMDIGAVTTHGMRSAFRDWAGDMTSFTREVAEAALAHKVGDEVERAYRRADALAKRRRLMDAWSSYLDKSAGGKVVQLRRT